MNKKRIVIAIDGPAGAGKSTLAKRVAEKLGFVYVNSGALYRAVALWALRLGVDLSDTYRVAQLAKEAQIELRPTSGRVFLNGEDVSEAIREPGVSEAASKISGIPAVRRALLNAQRMAAPEHNIVMEGRDIGSVVFPEAQVKIFLDAEPEVRARRRAREWESEGRPADASALTSEIEKRDLRDRTRAESPLVQAPDAELVDTTHLSLDEAEERILRIVRSRVSNGQASRAEEHHTSSA